MPRISKYRKRLIDDDPNEQTDPKFGHGVRCPNDFVDWSELHGEVKVSYMTKEELDEYTKGTRKVVRRK